MKRIVITVGIVAMMGLTGCNSEEKGMDYPIPEAGATYKLEGTVTTAGFTWKTNSEVGLYSAMDELKIINKECKIVGWANTDPIIDPETGENTNNYTPSEYEGMSMAIFDTPALDLVQGENAFMIYSPYNPELTYNRGTIYGLSISDDQTQPAPDVAADCFAFGTCKGIPGIDETFKFELTPVTALAQVTISSTELAGYSPEKVTIYDDAGTVIAGGFNVNIETLEFTQAGTPLNRASVTLESTVALTAGQSQNMYMNLLPVDFTGKDIWVIVELIKEEGSRLTIPTKKSNLKFEAGKTTKIDLTNLSTSMNAAGDWYLATETRLLAGDGVAYGDANTYFIQCKTGETYAGATYTPNSAIPDEITIDYRARGNFYNAVAPENVTFEWATMSSGSTYIQRTAGYEGSKIDPSKFEITVNEAAKTVTVKNVGAFAGAPILLMKKDGKVLWAWSFWNVAADGTSIDPISVGSFKLAPMDIGQASTQVSTWVANNDPIFRMTHMYQWGRPIPTYWNSYWSVDGRNGTTGNVPGIAGPLSFADALANPVGIIVDAEDNTDMPDWSTEHYADLWGGDVTAHSENQGIKSIYDPCPKGYRVACYDALDAVATAAATSGKFDDTKFAVGYTVNGYLFVSGGYVNGKTATNGRFATMGGGNGGTASACKYGLIWSNYLGSHSSVQPRGLYITSSSVGTAPSMRGFNKSVSAAVRCMVDEDNR